MPPSLSALQQILCCLPKLVCGSRLEVGEGPVAGAQPRAPKGSQLSWSGPQRTSRVYAAINREDIKAGKTGEGRTFRLWAVGVFA